MAKKLSPAQIKALQAMPFRGRLVGPLSQISTHSLDALVRNGLASHPEGDVWAYAATALGRHALEALTLKDKLSASLKQKG